MERKNLITCIILFFVIYVSVLNTTSYIENKAVSKYIVINRRVSAEEVENEPCSDAEQTNSLIQNASPILNTYEVKFDTYNVPLDEELQMYIIAMAKTYDLDPTLVFAIIRKESGYNIEAVSPGGGNVGLMQINYSNFGWLRRDLGITDFQDPYSNVHAGCYILSILFEKYEDTDKVLMAYNTGEGTAQAFWQRGIFTSHYTHIIHRYMEELSIETE